MPRESLASVQTPVAPDSQTLLKQPLQQVLASLSVDLETELVRYRQSRQGEGKPQAHRGVAFRKRRKPIDLIRVEGRSAPTTSPSPAQPPLGQPLPPPLPPNPRLTQTATAADASLTRLERPGETATDRPLTQETSLQPYQDIPEDFFETTEALLHSTPAVGNADSDAWDTDYTPALTQRLTTPLGIGALLLLLISSASLGYLLTNPKALAHLWHHPALLALRGQDAAGSATTSGVNGSYGTFEPGLEGLGPDLSHQEFVDLNLGSLSTLPNSALPTPHLASTPLTLTLPPTAVQPGMPGPAGTPNPTAPGSAATPTPTAATAPPPAYRPPVTVPATVRPVQAPTRPAPVAAAPTRPAPAQPAAARPAPSAPATPPPAQAAPPPLVALPSTAAPAQAAPNYYVVTDYTGDHSLSNARSAVGEAYVRNFPAGARIQMGAFEQQSSAEALVQDLQQQGISAEVYHPQ